MKKQKCECPTRGYVEPDRYYQYMPKEKKGMNHEPNECKGNYRIRLYKRGNKYLWLCSCCHFF